MIVRFGRVTVLLLGDAGEAVENSLAAQKKLPRADILKLSHHGSKTASSSALLDSTLPAYVVISVGRFNHFGMPHRVVLDRLRTRSIIALRTDKIGFIRFRTDGRVLELSRENEVTPGLY